MQIAPLIHGAKCHRPEPEIHVLTEAHLADLTGAIVGIDKVIPIERHSWLAALDNPEKSWVTRSNEVTPIAKILASEQYNRVINLTHTPESGYLATLTSADEISGVAGSRLGIQYTNKWERYFQTIINRRDLNAINLTDIHIGIAGIPHLRNCGSLSINRELHRRLKQLIMPDRNQQPNIIALQLGSHSPLRQWSLDHFLTTAKLISQGINTRFVLVGSRDESLLADEFTARSDLDVVNLVGKTSLVDLAAAISCCDLLITGDTGTLHLAAVLSIPTVSIFLGMARADDTAPYGAGHVIFEPVRSCYPCPEHSLCDHLSCHADVTPEAVSQTCLEIISNNPGSLYSTNTFRSRRTAFDEDGFLTLEGLNENGADQLRGLLKQLFIHQFSGTYAGVTNTPGHKVSNSELHALRHLSSLTRQGIDLCVLLEHNIANGNSLNGALRQVAIILLKIEKLSTSGGITGLFSHLHQLEMTSLKDEGLDSPAEWCNQLKALQKRIRFILESSRASERPIADQTKLSLQAAGAVS